MNDQGKQTTVRSVLLGLAVVSLAGTLGGCTAGVVKGDPGTRSSHADFRITFDTNAPRDEAVTVTPDDGDASLVSKKNPGEGDNKILWTADRPFGIKLVQIDDPDKSPRKKLGKENPGWNQASCNSAGTCVYKLELDEGKDGTKKEIRGAKYVVASPSGCSDEMPIPADCMWLDPVLIVRY